MIIKTFYLLNDKQLPLFDKPELSLKLKPFSAEAIATTFCIIVCVLPLNNCEIVVTSGGAEVNFSITELILVAFDFTITGEGK